VHNRNICLAIQLGRIRVVALQDEHHLLVRAQAQGDALQAGTGFKFQLRPEGVESGFGEVAFGNRKQASRRAKPVA
jgi:hypothetical protein